jgi:hypothetical protein
MSTSSPIGNGRFEFECGVSSVDTISAPVQIDELDLLEPADGIGDFEADAPESLTAADTINANGAAAAEWTGPRCEKCAAPIKSDVVTVCRCCGWYASLGIFVEIDPNWEQTDSSPQTSAPQAQPSHLQVWIKLIPRWGWVIIASVLAVIVESVIVRLATPVGSPLRTTWSLAQLFLGGLTIFCCHVFNFLVLAAEDTDVGLIDIVVKPVKLWVRTCRGLPARLRVVNLAACGLTAVLMSIVVIGAIPYERLWDWGITPPAEQNLMGAVMDRVNELEDDGDKDLEEAIGDFAGKAGIEEPPPPKPRRKADCVIIGYKLDKEGRLSTLVLGTAHLGQLVYAGGVAPPARDEAQSAELLAKLVAIRTQQRVLPVEIDAVWVKPQYACRVSYTERRRSGFLEVIEWDAFLGKLKGQ